MLLLFYYYYLTDIRLAELNMYQCICKHIFLNTRLHEMYVMDHRFSTHERRILWIILKYPVFDTLDLRIRVHCLALVDVQPFRNEA